MRGKLIVLEGLDRAGKSSQCVRLAERLQKENHKVRHMRFPGEYQVLYLHIQLSHPSHRRQNNSHRQNDRQLPQRRSRTRRPRNPPSLLSKSLGSCVSNIQSYPDIRNSSNQCLHNIRYRIWNKCSNRSVLLLRLRLLSRQR
jgi:Thymidylate kinase